MGSRIVERLERSEARRFPVAQREIGAAAGSDKNFRALILVDEDMARVELFELRHQEVDQHRLTAARWTNDHRMAQVCRMEIEVIGAASACLEQGDRRPPMIAVLVPCRERMEGRERREII